MSFNLLTRPSVVAGAMALAAAVSTSGRDAQRPAPISIGVEYVLIDKADKVGPYARELAQTGITAAKHYAEHVEWNEMQKSAAAPIDFSRLDSFVREFQAAGFADVVICLRSRSRWASKKYALLGNQNISPKPEHLEAYGQWIGAIVERYDADGRGDMPGLRRPVVWYEIGSELSTYEAEPVPEYLVMLERAYASAHTAFAGVKIAHAAFLTTNAFRDHPGPAGYERAFASVDKRIMYHGLPAIRAVLDRGDLFDVVNIHSLGDPAELEDMVAWLNWEMNRRRWTKPIIVSDTAATPFIAWGNAVTCTGLKAFLGLMVAPATERDRCRLAAYFTKLVASDPATIEWTHQFLADDLIKRVVIAADQGIVLINTAFVEDLHLLKMKAMNAGAGTSAWSGMIDLVKRERRPAFTALKNVTEWLKDYDAIRRVSMPDSEVRVYEVRKGGGVSWIGWLHPSRVWLPEDEQPSRDVVLPGGRTVRLMTTPTRIGA